MKLGKFSGGCAIIPTVVIVYDFQGVITMAIIPVTACANLNGRVTRKHYNKKL